MALKVIGAGFGRTGTMSMKAALEQLGYRKCHHMLEVLKPKAEKQLDFWDRIGKGERPGWDEVFDGFEASVDFPSCVYWQELADAYPDAKVVLTVRSFESWYDSASSTIYATAKSMPSWTKLIPRARKIDRVTHNIIWNGKFDGRFEDKAYAQKVWNDHISAVKTAIPPERLLVFEVKEGWAPLCDFLGDPVPDKPFPRVNDKAQFLQMVKRMGRLAYVPWIVGAVLLASAIGLYAAFQ
ncbi:MAG: sulfotransferase [Henriciella sp.]|nr:sulfotransferase [Henriciella sp.]